MSEPATGTVTVYQYCVLAVKRKPSTSPLVARGTGSAPGPVGTVLARPVSAPAWTALRVNGLVSPALSDTQTR